MNKSQLVNNVGSLVRLRPVARRPAPGGDLPHIDDEWVMEQVEDQGVRLYNLHTGHVPLLGFDQIHSYTSNPTHNVDGRKHGFLQLRVQLSLLPHGIHIELLPPGSWA